MKIENGMPLMLEEMIPHEERGWRPASLGECAAEIERLRAALTDLLWYVGQLEPLVYSADDTADHYTVANARAALK